MPYRRGRENPFGLFSSYNGVPLYFSVDVGGHWYGCEFVEQGHEPVNEPKCVAAENTPSSSINLRDYRVIPTSVTASGTPRGLVESDQRPWFPSMGDLSAVRIMERRL